MKYLPFLKTALIALFVLTMISCEKDAGEGGNSSIYGKVWVRDYNVNFTILQYTYFGPDEDVYIIYGNNKTYGDRVKTSYDGTYEFKYLRPGKYKIYVYSKDSTMQTSALLPVIKEVEITDDKQEVFAGISEILK